MHPWNWLAILQWLDTQCNKQTTEEKKETIWLTSYLFIDFASGESHLKHWNNSNKIGVSLNCEGVWTQR